MAEKHFAFEQAKTAEREDYHAQILRIINEFEQKARYVVPDPVLNRELHEKRFLDASRENQEFAPTRKDICDSFGVVCDDEHVYLYPTETKSAEQRALRAFFVLIDAIKKEGFYGEGRIDHNTLFRALVEKAGKHDDELTFESVVKRMNVQPPHYLVFKGFLSTKAFREITESSRRVLETPLFDSLGNKIETADDWFLTGHNLEGHTASNSESRMQ